MKTEDSITRWMDELSHADPTVRAEAAWKIWDFYTPRLLALASRHMERRLRARVDPDDVLQSVYRSFFRRRAAGGPRPRDRDELLVWLIRGTLNKVYNAANHHRAGGRDYRREQEAWRDWTDGAPPSWLLEHMGRGEPTPEEATVLAEELERWIRVLPEDLGKVALWKLEGYTNVEIAGMLERPRTVRTVELYLQRIRRTLAPLLTSPPPDEMDGKSC